MRGLTAGQIGFGGSNATRPAKQCHFPGNQGRFGLKAGESWGTKAATVHGSRLISKTGEDHNVGVDTSKGHSAMDYNEHNRTYAGFLSFSKYAIIFLVLLLAGMKFFLV